MATEGINIPLDVGAFLGDMKGKTGNNTQIEDHPSNPSPAVITEFQNVLPTSLGYHSAFDFVRRTIDIYPDAAAFPQLTYFQDSDEQAEIKNLIKSANIQKVIPWESGALERCYILMGEAGIFIHTPVEGNQYDSMPPPGMLKDFEVIDTLEPELKFVALWSTAVLDNRVYCFRQGLDYCYVIGNPTLKTMLDNSKAEHEVILEREDSGLIVAKATPTFLNMEGQVGCFKAGNRLGFWDSDNSIAWGSAFDKLDFTPDVVSMAGITRFAETAGEITTVLSTTKGFVIYCTGSIVQVDPLERGEERWTATSLMRGNGVDFYTHVSVGYAPDLHIAWTREGCYAIAGGRVQPFITEEYRYLTSQLNPLKESPLFAVNLIGSDYLVISQSNNWTASEADTDYRFGSLSHDWENHFYLHNESETMPETTGEFWEDVIRGSLPNLINPKFDPADWDIGGDELDPFPPLSQNKPLIPCYSGYSFLKPTNLGNLTIDWDQTTQQPIDPFVSAFWDGVTVTPATELLVRDPDGGPNDSLTIPSNTPQNWETKTAKPFVDFSWQARKPPLATAAKFYDKGGEEFQDVIRDSIADFMEAVTPLWDESEGLLEGQFLFDERPTRPWMRYPLPEKGWEFWISLEDDHDIPGQLEDTVTATFPIERNYPKPTEAELEEYADWAYKPWRFEMDKLFYSPNTTTIHPSFKRYHVPKIAHKLPVKSVGLRIVEDSCSIKIMAYVDDWAMTRISWFDIAPQYPAFRLEYDEDKGYESVPQDFTSWYSEDYVMGLKAYEYHLRLDSVSKVFPASFIGKTAEEINYLLDPANYKTNPCWVPIFEAEVSGMGYIERISSSWTRFVRTISRGQLWVMSGDECEYKERPKSWEYEHPDVPPQKYENIRLPGQTDYSIGSPNIGDNPSLPGLEGFPDGWGYPRLSPLQFIYSARFKRGSKAPHYPVYEKAWVYDLSLQKWGQFQHPHSLIFSIMPENSGSSSPSMVSDLWAVGGGGKNATLLPFGILPKFVRPLDEYGFEYQWDDPYGWNALDDKYWDYSRDHLVQHQLPTFLSTHGAQGRLVLNSVQASRDGYTKMVGLSGSAIGDCSIEVRASLYGEDFGSSWETNHLSVDKETNTAYGNWKSQQIEFKDFRLPFVLTGKEYQIAVKGAFRLSKLILYGQPTGGVRFFGTHYTYELQ